VKTLVVFVRYEVWSILGAMAFIVGYQLLTGQIRTKGLLSDKDGSFSPSRVQMLVATLAAAGFVLAQTIKDPTHFPTLPTEMVLALGGSHGVYLGAKFSALMGDKLGSLLLRIGKGPQD